MRGECRTRLTRDACASSETAAAPPLTNPQIGAPPAGRPCGNHTGEIVMAANLTSLVMQFLTPEVIEKIASFLGLDRTATQKAAGGAVPALLAGLSDLVATPTGTSQLSKLLSQQPGGSPTDLLRSTGPEALADTGANMLSGLFGGRTM